jgi:hypothetical protein
MRGITITLVERIPNGEDDFGNATFSEEEVQINDVLVGEPTTDDIQNAQTSYGKVVAYVLGIPKGDEHTWTDGKVILPAPFTGTYNVLGDATAGIEANIPLRWNKKVKLERIV